MTSPNKEGYLIPELAIRISPAWVNLVLYCQQNLQHGKLAVKINNAEPTELDWKNTSLRVRFDKQDPVSMLHSPLVPQGEQEDDS
jgi:hypothetical protein